LAQSFTPTRPPPKKLRKKLGVRPNFGWSGLSRPPQWLRAPVSANAASTRGVDQGAFTAHELNRTDLQQVDPAAPRVHWSRLLIGCSETRSVGAQSARAPRTLSLKTLCSELLERSPRSPSGNRGRVPTSKGKGGREVEGKAIASFLFNFWLRFKCSFERVKWLID